VEREDRQIYTFTDADLINLCAYDLPHLHGYLTGRLESKRDYAIFLRRVVLVMKEQIIFNSKIDFEIGWQLGEDKIALTKPDDTHPGIEHWVTNSVVTSPVLGFVYVDNNEKKVFKVFEAAKYSNQTLTRIENTINSLKGGEFVQTEPANQIIQAINAQKAYRRLIIQMRITLRNDFLNPIDNLTR
jgi:hypothetical protein